MNSSACMLLKQVEHRSKLTLESTRMYSRTNTGLETAARSWVGNLPWPKLRSAKLNSSRSCATNFTPVVLVRAAAHWRVKNAGPHFREPNSQDRPGCWQL